jgi:hypothetical protein
MLDTGTTLGTGATLGTRGLLPTHRTRTRTLTWDEGAETVSPTDVVSGR